MSNQLRNLQKCTDAINDWHLINFLQLNLQKSKIMFNSTIACLKSLSPHPPQMSPFFLRLLLLNSSVLLLILISASKNIPPPLSNQAIISSGQFGISVHSSSSTQLLPLHTVSFSLTWTTAIPFSRVHLPA